MINKIKFLLKKHPFLSQILTSITIGFLAVFSYYIYSLSNGSTIQSEDLLFLPILIILFSALLIYPIFIIAYQTYMLLKIKSKEEEKNIFYDIWTIFLAFFYQFIFLSIDKNVVFNSTWKDQLYNYEVHSPIYVESYLSILKE